ncbi:hypothetical protein ACFYVL_19185 [Streptomyces sp. NPDC004111]|uniref:hypothetical protein n=1 Tax=Streptomyces sp. NPDC004111 TaxID=3364690 RepID=UPI0036B36A3D
MTHTRTPAPRRFLVLHDYGMGGCWWWILARSEREVLETFAWVEVVDDPRTVARFETDEDTEVVDIDAPRMPPGLDTLRAERAAQRDHPDFGALAGRDVVHLRRRWDEDDEEPVDYLMEIGPDGRRSRQVEVAEDGTAVRSTPDDWDFNPPVVDLYAPASAAQEIGPAEFEEHWARARPMTEADR